VVKHGVRLIDSFPMFVGLFLSGSSSKIHNPRDPLYKHFVYVGRGFQALRRFHLSSLKGCNVDITSGKIYEMG
jgi:hypothetical protein